MRTNLTLGCHLWASYPLRCSSWVLALTAPMPSDPAPYILLGNFRLQFRLSDTLYTSGLASRVQIKMAGVGWHRDSFSRVPVPFPFEPPHSARHGLKSYIRLSRVFPRIAASLFQNPADAFRDTYQWVEIIGEHARARIENRQLWGLLWGPLIHLGESRHISNQLATTTELVEPERVAGLSAFRSTS